MLPEVMNHIFSYCQGATNKIMKQHIKYSHGFETGVIGLTRLNRQYGFKTFNKKKSEVNSKYNYQSKKKHIYLQNIKKKFLLIFFLDKYIR